MAGNIMTNAYNQMSAVYGIQMGASNKYDSHKRSELRMTYNRIIKSTKESPLYRIKDAGDFRKFAISVKEQAHTIKNVVASLSENGEGMERAFQKRIASSDNPEVATAEYIGSDSDFISPESAGFHLEVKQLATPQVNRGHFMRRTGHDFKDGRYRFDLNTSSTSYEFQYNVGIDDTNEEVLNKLRKLINNANIGLQAELVADGRGYKALQIESRQTGYDDGEDRLFDIIPANDDGSREAMELLGIDAVSSPAENSSFLLNGTLHSSYTNTFTVNNMFSVTLNGVSRPGRPVSIGFKPSVDTVIDDVEALASAYNGIIDVANSYADSKESSGTLLGDMGRVAKRFSRDFAEMGISIGDDYSMTIDRKEFAGKISGADAAKTFGVLNRFRDALGKKADEASINPMNYVNRVIVSYKHPNPNKNFAAPYISSLYSGMMLDYIL